VGHGWGRVRRGPATPTADDQHVAAAEQLFGAHLDDDDAIVGLASKR